MPLPAANKSRPTPSLVDEAQTTGTAFQQMKLGFLALRKPAQQEFVRQVLRLGKTTGVSLEPIVHFLNTARVPESPDAALTQRRAEAAQVAALAQRRGEAHIARAVADKELLKSTELESRLHWSRQALSKALRSRRVFFVESAGTRYYPAFFADPSFERRHLEAVSKLLGDLPGTAKLLFMTTPKASLGGKTPLQALRQGELSAVKTAAEGFAQN